MKESLSLHSEPAELGRLVAFAEAFALRHALPAPERVRLLIMLEELFTNSVEHGYDGPTSRGRIEVALACDAAHFTIEFSDDGRPFDPLAAELADFVKPAAGRIGGFGLRIVRSLADEVRYAREAGRNCLVLTRSFTGRHSA